MSKSKDYFYSTRTGAFHNRFQGRTAGVVYAAARTEFVS